MLGDGRIEYIGRTDLQVKFRGQRIELGEIETALIGISPIGQAVVVVAPAAAGELLAAYLVPTPGESIDTEEVRSALGGVLPSYMVPSAFVMLDALPLNPAGKLDRRALPDPVFEARKFRSPANRGGGVGGGSVRGCIGRRASRCGRRLLFRWAETRCRR
ncbi:hypothetical protein [Rhodococcus sp. (in: high G+C Gram-positive bacteria)]|uniref:AMP-binding enzyme n=1 Tax=Rhodococcus sp. TaxID=1831 RepID=UPI003260B558